MFPLGPTAGQAPTAEPVAGLQVKAFQEGSPAACHKHGRDQCSKRSQGELPLVPLAFYEKLY